MNSSVLSVDSKSNDRFTAVEQRHQIFRSPTVCRSVLCLIIILYGEAAFLSQRRYFHVDEFWHLHTAWGIFKGWLPYRDYFDHHAPLYYFLLAPFLSFFDVDTRPADAIGSLFFLRQVMWALSGIILLLTYFLGRLWRNAPVGCAATLFLMATDAYWSTSLEIRPDPLAVAFWLLYLIFVVRGMRSNAEKRYKNKLFVWSGVFLGLAFVSLQKVAFAFPGLAVATCWYLFSSSIPATRRVRLHHIAYQVGGFCVPLALVAGYFYFQGGLAMLVYYNFLFNAGMERLSHYLYGGLHEAIWRNPYLALFGTAGLIVSLLLLLKTRAIDDGDFVVAAGTLSLIAGLFIIPVPFYQYYLLFLPLVALSAADCLFHFMTKLLELRARLSVFQWMAGTALICLVVLSSLLLLSRGAGSLQWQPVVVSAYWLCAFVGSIALLSVRLGTVALCFFLIGLGVPQLLRLWGGIISPDPTPQLEEIRYIIQHTEPTDTVLAGARGSGVFRRHAYPHYNPFYRVQRSSAEHQRQEILEGLQSGAIAPKMIVFDQNLEDFSPEITKFLKEHYEPVGVGVIWTRKVVTMD